ncbi:hypothetical protein CFOL_v3_13772 [Cephalotus follicularis]|uniref:Uncharacterized protein n=1 Tax=Cephalotus follicularis TaxID=3775 RepID=A0A1Q3BQZ9_CEPFO|nr:hypothetical protein CFOL_v3_13772 [Cephalotus follicularis]
MAKEVVDKLKLAIEKHPHPYKVSWFRRGNEIPINSRCLVQFSMGNAYKDEVWCDVIPMDACHILLGRSYLYDRDMIHHSPNTYTFYKDNRKLTLQPLKQESTSGKIDGKSNSFLTARQFDKLSSWTQVVHVLFGRIVGSKEVEN